MKQNLYKTVPNNLPEELIEKLVSSHSVQIERIVSRGHSSPPGFWYDQESSEFVLLLSGSARLSIEGANNSIDLGPGDWLNIPAHTKHRVEWTDPSTHTIWLAVHYGTPINT